MILSYSKCSCEIILWSQLVSHPSAVGVGKISCRAASRPAGAGGAPHAPESAWQAVNHVRSFICQSPPKCRAVRMDNSPQHRHAATSSCLAEWLSESQSQRSQSGPSDSCTWWCHSDNSNTGGSVQHLTEQHFFFHSSSLFGSLSTGAFSVCTVNTVDQCTELPYASIMINMKNKSKQTVFIKL